MRSIRNKRDALQIKDAMLAIAATAIGFAWVQAQWDTIQLFAGQYANRPQYTKWFLGDRPFYQMTRMFTKDAIYVATALVCPWMVVLLLRARRGGRFWRAQRPGAVACLAGTGVLIFELRGWPSGRSPASSSSCTSRRIHHTSESGAGIFLTMSSPRRCEIPSGPPSSGCRATPVSSSAGHGWP